MEFCNMCKYQISINIGIEGCDTSWVGSFILIHVPLLIPRLNLDTSTTLVRAHGPLKKENFSSAVWCYEEYQN